MRVRPATRSLPLPVLIAAAACVLQALTAVVLLDASASRSRTEFRRLQVQVAVQLAGELSRAVAGNDDLAALAVLRAARINFPQLRDAMIFDHNGRIVLHTDSGMLGKSTAAPTGPRLTVPETTFRREQGRPLASVLVPLDDADGGYFRATFDESRQEVGSAALAARGLLAAALSAALLGFLVWNRRRSEARTLDAQREPESPAPRPGLHPDRAAQLLLAELPHAALAVNRENRIVAANTLILELLACRAEELETLHVQAAPLPEALAEFYRAALEHPGQPRETALALKPGSPRLTARIAFTPPGDAWELAVLTCR